MKQMVTLVFGVTQEKLFYTRGQNINEYLNKLNTQYVDAESQSVAYFLAMISEATSFFQFLLIFYEHGKKLRTHPI